MLYVFYVINGVMMKFEMNPALSRVQKLKLEIEKKYSIQSNNMILLTSNGEQLEDDFLVGKYPVTDTNPIYLFCLNEETIKINSCMCVQTKQNKLCNCQTSEIDLKNSLDTYIEKVSTNSTSILKELANLANQVSSSAKVEESNCESLVQGQLLQKNGWAAVIANLEILTSEFITRVEDFASVFENNLEKRSLHLELIEQFPRDLKQLAEIPIIAALRYIAAKEFHVFDEILENDSQESILSKLSEVVSIENKVSNTLSNFAGKENLSLLEWITVQETPSSLHCLAEVCLQSLTIFDQSTFDAVKSKNSKIIENAQNEDYKEIKGLENRLIHLDKLMDSLRKKVQDQKDLAASFHVNTKFVHNENDSIIRELCASHKNQLEVMRRNFNEISEIRGKILKSKEEIGSNLFERLKFVVKVQNSMSDADNKQLFYHHVLKRAEKCLYIIEQIHSAPQLYINAIIEIYRRKQYSNLFLDWTSCISAEFGNINEEEILRRKQFNETFKNHFLNKLFPGLNDMPPHFAPEISLKFDSSLPIISKSDLEILASKCQKVNMQEIETCTLYFDDKFKLLGQTTKDCKTTKIQNILEKNKLLINRLSESLDNVQKSGINNEYKEIENDLMQIFQNVEDDSMRKTMLPTSTQADNPMELINCVEMFPSKNKEIPIEKNEDSNKIEELCTDKRERVYSSTSYLKPQQKTAVIENCRRGDTVIVYWDKDHNQYSLLQDSDIHYFVHNESLSALNLTSPPEVNTKTFFKFAKVFDKEYCQAKKDENRYKVEKGTRFYRMKLVPLIHNKYDSKNTNMIKHESSYLDLVTKDSNLSLHDYNNSVVDKNEDNKDNIQQSNSNLSHSIGLFTVIEPIVSPIISLVNEF